MSDETLVHLRSLDPRFAPYAFFLVAAARRAGIPLIVISGRRRSPITDRYGNIAERSLHLQGLAIDVQVEGYQVADLPYWWWQSLGEWWEALGGRWGGRFVHVDLNHLDAGWLGPTA